MAKTKTTIQYLVYRYITLVEILKIELSLYSAPQPENNIKIELSLSGDREPENNLKSVIDT